METENEVESNDSEVVDVLPDAAPNDVIEAPELVEVAEDSPKGFDDILKARAEGTRSNPKQQEIKDESEEEEEVLEEKEKPEVVTSAKKPELLQKPPEVKKPKVARDYTGFEPDEIEMLKQVGNTGFAKFKELLLKEKEAKKNPKPETRKIEVTIDNPDGYTLTPEYKKLEATHREAVAIKEHWKLQAINIRKNGKFIDLDRDPTSGKLITSPEREATVEDELEVERHYEGTKDQADAIKGKLNEIANGYKSKFQNEVAFLKDTEEKYFPGYGDENHATKAIQQQLISVLPASFQKHPLASLLAKSGAVNVQSVNRIKELEAENVKLKGIKTDARRAPPTKAGFVSSKPSGAKITSFEDMAKVRRGEM